jgi:hypothetical protein
LIPGEDNDREGRFFLVPILVQLDEATGGKSVKKSLRSHPNVVKAMTADPDDPTSTGLYLSLEASQGVSWYVVQVYDFEPEHPTHAARMVLGLVATSEASMPAPFTMEPHSDMEDSMGTIFTIDYPCETVYLPGATLQGHLSAAYKAALVKSVPIVPAGLPAGSTLADAKHMFSPCDGKWSFRQITDHAKHALTLNTVLPLLRLIGYSDRGRARHLAFFLSRLNYTLDSAHIRKVLLSLHSLFTTDIFPVWIGHSVQHVFEAAKLNVFMDAKKFDAFCQLQFSPFDTEGAVSLGLADFVPRPTFWPYCSWEHDHVFAAITGLQTALFVLGGHGDDATCSLYSIILKLRNDSLGLRRDYDARVLDYSFRQALRRFSVVMREDSVPTSRAHVFTMMDDTGPTTITLLRNMLVLPLETAALDRIAAGLPRYLQLEKDEIAAARSTLKPILIGSGAQPPKKQRVTPPDSEFPNDGEVAYTPSKFDRKTPCNKDILNHFGVVAKNGKVPEPCSNPHCHFGHPNKGLFKGMGLEKIKAHVRDFCSTAVKASVMAELDSKTKHRPAEDSR